MGTMKDKSFRWILSRREWKKEDLHHFLFKVICRYNKSYASLHTKPIEIQNVTEHQPT